MPEAVLSLRGILADQIRWRVTIIARRHAPVARFDPAIILFLHDVTVHTGFGIIRQVGSTLGIDERERADAERQAQRSTQNDSSDSRASHLLRRLRRYSKSGNREPPSF